MIVATAARVQLASSVAGKFHQPCFDKRMNVFGFYFVKVAAVGLAALEDSFESCFDLAGFFFADNFRCGKTIAVSDAGANVSRE